MNRAAAIIVLVVLLACSQLNAFGYDWPAWLQSAPLNTDSSVVGFPSAMGLAKAYRYLAYLLNFAVLAGLLYALAKNEADYSHFIEVYLGILVGGIVLSFALSRFLHAFALLPVIALTKRIRSQRTESHGF